MGVVPKLKLVEPVAGVAVLVVPKDNPPLAETVPKPPVAVPAVLVPNVKPAVVPVLPNVEPPAVDPAAVAVEVPKLSPPDFAVVLKFRAVAWVGCANPAV